MKRKWIIQKLEGLLPIAERYSFYILLIVNLLPVLAFKYFPTVDGPAHLYNSKLITELLTHNTLIGEYYALSEISPNWLGHVLLSGFLSIFPAFIAEKCLLLIYFIGFPLSFRAFVRIQPNHNESLILFVFPFTYSFLLFYGFFNFHIGLVFFFCS